MNENRLHYIRSSSIRQHFVYNGLLLNLCRGTANYICQNSIFLEDSYFFDDLWGYPSWSQLTLTAICWQSTQKVSCYKFCTSLVSHNNSSGDGVRLLCGTISSTLPASENDTLIFTVSRLVFSSYRWLAHLWGPTADVPEPFVTATFCSIKLPHTDGRCPQTTLEHKQTAEKPLLLYSGFNISAKP